VVEHGSGKLAPSTLNTVTAAQALGAPITALVAGQDVAAAAQQAARIEGVSKASAAASERRCCGSPPAPPGAGSRAAGPRAAADAALPAPLQVLVADDASLARPLAEPLAELLAAVQAKRRFSHILAPSSTFGKNLLPRCGALRGLDGGARASRQPRWPGAAVAAALPARRCCAGRRRCWTCSPSATPRRSWTLTPTSGGPGSCRRAGCRIGPAPLGLPSSGPFP
jgi:hypothetical protein